MRRTSEGRFVEAERKFSTSDMEFDGRTFRGMAIELHTSIAVSRRMVKLMAFLTLSATYLNKDLNIIGRQRGS
jgi:hypothetical protein